MIAKFYYADDWIVITSQGKKYRFPTYDEMWEFIMEMEG